MNLASLFCFEAVFLQILFDWGATRINFVDPFRGAPYNKKESNPFGICLFISQNFNFKLHLIKIPGNKKSLLSKTFLFCCGEDRIRTDDLLTASQAL